MEEKTRSNVLSMMRSWYAALASHPPANDPFYDHLLEHPAPLDEHPIAKLRASRGEPDDDCP